MDTSSTDLRGKALGPTRELELSVIGSLLLDEAGRAESLSMLSAEMFLDLPERTIYEVLSSMVVAGAHVDGVTLLEELRHRGVLERAGGVETLGLALQGVPCADKSKEYASRLARATRKRRVIHAMTRMTSELSTGIEEDVDAGLIFDRISKAAGLVEGEKLLISTREMMADFDPTAHKAKLDSPDRAKAGLTDIDTAIDLFKPSNFTVLAARPAVGKSTLMRQMAMSAAQAGPVLIFSLEEANDVVRDKMICARAQVPYDTFYRGATTDDQDAFLMAAAGAIYELPIWYYGGYSCEAARVKLAIRSMVEKGEKPVAVFVDHLQLMRHAKAENRDMAVGETTRELRLASLEFGVPIILLCQMNRAIDQRGGGDKRPRLSDLRESGNIEANAVNVAFLWRESTEPDQANVVTFTLAKHRDGPTTEFGLVLLKAVGMFGQAPRYGGGM